jgi:hypothetical protein
MPSSSLNKMTVPLASDQSATTQGLLMPKLRYRFRVIFENLGVSTPTTELTKQVVSFTRPNLTFEEIALPIYNSTVKLAGRHSWADVSCEIRDDANGNVSKLIGEQIQKQMDFLEMSSAAAGIDYKFLTRFEVLDGGNAAGEAIALETWEIYGCYLKEVNYNNMDYSLSEVASINMIMRFDNANQTQGEGVGNAIGRTVGDVATGVG